MKIYKLLLKKFKRYRNVSFWIEDRYVHIEVYKCSWRYHKAYVIDDKPKVIVKRIMRDLKEAA
jgi:hypothetical protein